jgi:phage-related protein (TIGR01555 family)
MAYTAADRKNLLDRATDALATRFDGWVNSVTGFGTLEDKTSQGYFEPTVSLDPLQWINIYEGDKMAARIVDLIPEEMLRQGFNLVRKGANETDEKDVSASEAMTAAFEALKVGAALEEAIAWGRCTGGALVFIGCDDGRDASLPLDVKAVKRVAFLKVYDRSRIQVAQRITKKDERYGEPEIYRLTDVSGMGGGALVHASRCLRFGGARTSDQRKTELDGWDLSVLHAVHDGIRKFHEDHKTASLLMVDASQGVWKMAGIVANIAAGRWDKVATRIAHAERMRSAARAVVLDPEHGEDFTKVQNAFAGIADMIDRSGNYLSALTGIPVTLLIGTSPAGLNATGASDIRMFYDRVKTTQRAVLVPPIMRLIEVITRGEQQGWSVEFPPLWQEAPSEKASREKIEAETAQVYITNEVVTPEEVALSPRLAELYPALDRELRRTLQDRETERALEEPAAEPAAPAPAAPVPA